LQAELNRTDAEWVQILEIATSKILSELTAENPKLEEELHALRTGDFYSLFILPLHCFSLSHYPFHPGT